MLPLPAVSAVMCLTLLSTAPVAGPAAGAPAPPVEAAATTAPVVDPLPPVAPPMAPAPAELQPAPVTYGPAAAVAAAPAPPPPTARRGRRELDPYERELRRQRRAGGAMLGAGFGAFGLLYLGAAFAGTTAIDQGRDLSDDGVSEPRQVAYGQRLLIPVGGPFAAAAVAPGATEALLVSLVGVGQAAGLAVGITGAVLTARSRARQLERLRVGPGQGGGIAFRF